MDELDFLSRSFALRDALKKFGGEEFPSPRTDLELQTVLGLAKMEVLDVELVKIAINGVEHFGPVVAGIAEDLALVRGRQQ